MNTIKTLVSTAVVSYGILSSTASFAGDSFTIKNGELERPTDYREWVYVGTPVTPNDMNEGKAAGKKAAGGHESTLTNSYVVPKKESN